MLRKNPIRNARGIIYSSNEYLCNLPVDKSASGKIHPILDMTKQQNYFDQPWNIRNDDLSNHKYWQKEWIQATKPKSRNVPCSVSETKKKDKNRGIVYCDIEVLKSYMSRNNNHNGVMVYQPY